MVFRNATYPTRQVAQIRSHGISAHKLATLILDGIAWKEGYNGLSRGTAAFTLSVLEDKMGFSRQYLTVFLSELEASDLELVRQKPNGKFAPWLFRFSAFDEDEETHDLVSGEGDTSLSRDNNNKTIFSGLIDRLHLHCSIGNCSQCYAHSVSVAGRPIDDLRSLALVSKDY